MNLAVSAVVESAEEWAAVAVEDAMAAVDAEAVADARTTRRAPGCP